MKDIWVNSQFHYSIAETLKWSLMDEVKVSMTDFCLLQDAHDYWKCPKANKGLNFEQCYKM